MSTTPPETDLRELAGRIKAWGHELGFQQVGITGIELEEDEARLLAWLAQGRHGEMAYMQRHGTQRSRPAELFPGTARVISVRMDYWPPDSTTAERSSKVRTAPSTLHNLTVLSNPPEAISFPEVHKQHIQDHNDQLG